MTKGRGKKEAEGKEVRLAAKLFLGLEELLPRVFCVTLGNFLDSSSKFT